MLAGRGAEWAVRLARAGWRSWRRPGRCSARDARPAALKVRLRQLLATFKDERARVCYVGDWSFTTRRETNRVIEPDLSK